jgi:copper chaperone NosL
MPSDLLKRRYVTRRPSERAAGGTFKLLLCVVIFLLPLTTRARTTDGETGFVKPSGKDKCPVCGMFVSGYSDWVAEVVYRDGTYRVFDGAKDLFKYLADLKTYEPQRKLEAPSFVYVTDYYNVRPIDGRKAFFVLGSDVFGPMGAELIPFEKETDAAEFMKDHKGRRILGFSEVVPAVLKTLE